MAEVIRTRIRQIKTAKNTEELLRFHVGRCHALKGDRAGQFAMVGLPTMLDLVHPYRLIFERIGEVVQIAWIVEILDFVKLTTIRVPCGGRRGKKRYSVELKTNV